MSKFGAAVLIALFAVACATTPANKASQPMDSTTRSQQPMGEKCLDNQMDPECGGNVTIPLNPPPKTKTPPGAAKESDKPVLAFMVTTLVGLILFL